MPSQSNWSQSEINIALSAYLELLELERAGQTFSTTEVQRRLSSGLLSGRSEGSVGRRMSNISSVFQENGHDWVEKYKPTLTHTGTNVANMILNALVDLTAKDAAAYKDGIELIELANGFIREGLKSKPAGSRKPRKRQQSVTVFERSAAVVAWVLNEANGVCEACSAAAPFALPSGYPYLEVHHVRRLADGGPDVAENAVALCPNCHRRLHHSTDAESYREKILSTVLRLEAFPTVGNEPSKDS